MTVSAPADRFSLRRPSSSTSPPARRPSRPGWRDPRFAVGVVLLCGSVLLGARVMSSADDTVAVWGARTSLVKGQELATADLVPVRVRFAEEASADRYVAAADQLPDGMFLTRDVGAGELVARAALGQASEEALVEVPLSVEAAAIPSSVSVGSRVDVWVAPASGSRSGGGRPVKAVRVLADVAVVADGSPGVSGGLGGSAALPVVVGVPPSLQDDLPDVLARVGDGAVVLVRRPG